MVSHEPVTGWRELEAEAFARLLPLDKIYAPHISLAGDGEITFLWILPNFRLDLGFFGVDGTYAYYGKTLEGDRVHGRQ